jgi:dTDP-4-amino-4,6-dideoxygalactose transaminase
MTAKTITSRMKTNDPIFVGQPTMPPLEELIPYLEEIWRNKILTNVGPFHVQFERALCEYLGIKHISLFNNGTIALLIALQALRVTGEVITTPYSFVATAHSLLWNGIKPIFVDIDPATLNLDPARIEPAITPQTTAIMPVHCYGHPCDVDGIRKIAEKYGLKVIYDAAPAFGVRTEHGSVLDNGDLSVLSFHATKVFNTFEGGAIACPNSTIKTRIDRLKNFGYENETKVVLPGINGKMSEFNAAFGLLQLKRIDAALERRAAIDAQYRAGLAGIDGIFYLPDAGEKVANYAYFPIMVRPEYPLSRDALYQKLRDNKVFARRYFYPLISDFPMYRSLSSAAPANLPNARLVAETIICLPMSSNLRDEDVERVVSCIAG